MAGRAFALIAIVGVLIAAFGLYSLGVCFGGDITTPISQCKSELYVTIIGIGITALAGGGGAAAA